MTYAILVVTSSYLPECVDFVSSFPLYAMVYRLLPLLRIAPLVQYSPCRHGSTNCTQATVIPNTIPCSVHFGFSMRAKLHGIIGSQYLWSHKYCCFGLINIVVLVSAPTFYYKLIKQQPRPNTQVTKSRCFFLISPESFTRRFPSSLCTFRV